MDLTFAPALGTSTARVKAEPAFELGYRSELDGIRGISIILVLLLHLRIDEVSGGRLPGFTGGFLGVDIFFVLSGFLITSLLMQEWDRTGSISLRRFYLRRALRLGPALLVILPLVCSAAFIFGNQQLVRETSTGAWLTLTYVSNWFFAFDCSSADTPFGITWSLAIEEQFYVFWPLILLLALKLKIKRPLILSALVFAVCLVVFHRYLLATNGARVMRLYYATDTRADELLIGSATGLLISWGWVPRSRRAEFLLKMMAGLGLALLTILVIHLSSDELILYLGGFTVISVAIASILFMLIHSPPKLALTALRFGPLRWFGRVSYGLYLWHWAVLKFIYPKGHAPSITQMATTLLLALLFTSLSYYLVEHRFLRLKERLGYLKVKGKQENAGIIATDP